MDASTVLVAFLTLVVVYYVYNWLSTTGDMQDVVIYRNLNKGLLAQSSSVNKYDNTNTALPSIYGGGEYSVSTWIYITNWSINSGQNKVFLTLSGGGTNGVPTMVMYLGQNTNKLGVRVSYSVSNPSSDTQSQLNQSQMSLLYNGTTPYSDNANDFKMCDIETVDLQRWVNITTVLSGRTLDIYIDGKLSRSCVLNGVYTVDGDGSNTAMTLGGVAPAVGRVASSPNGFGGYIGQTRAANYAYSPDQVYTNYLAGPTDTSLFSQLFGNMFSSGPAPKTDAVTYTTRYTAPTFSYTPPSISFQ